MKFQQVRGRSKADSNLPKAMLLVFALALMLLPAANARQQDGRPRRASDAQPAQQNAAPAQTPAAQQSPAQQQTPPGAPKLRTQPDIAREQEQAEQDAAQDVEDEDVIRIDTNLINLQVRVVDRNNRPVNGVRPEEFRVFENGVPQTIQFVSQEEVPISYGLVVDNSGSLRSQINQVIEAGKTIVSSNKPGDETFVVRFVGSDEIKVMQDFTADRQAVNDALEDMYVEGGRTAVIDAVYLASEHASEHKKGNPLEDKRRRALILVTDGEDRASFYKQEQLFASLKEMDVQIYVIGFVNELDREGGLIKKSPREKAVNLLNKLASETGGRAFFPSSLSELPGIANEITKDMRTQYVVSYKPATKARPGEFRSIRVAVADAPGQEKRIALTRAGYTGKADGGQPQAAERPNSGRRQ